MGFERGQLQEAREMLLEAVATRFGAVPQDVTAAVQRLETVEPLRGLLRQTAAQRDSRLPVSSA